MTNMCEVHKTQLFTKRLGLSSSQLHLEESECSLEAKKRETGGLGKVSQRTTPATPACESKNAV